MYIFSMDSKHRKAIVLVIFISYPGRNYTVAPRIDTLFSIYFRY